ncbi:MAG: hypothetical protein ACOX6Q_03860 [Candidatus Dojkabacteria bacterium]|jgi:hypothetical protein
MIEYNSENTGLGGTVSTPSSNLTQFDNQQFYNNNDAALTSSKEFPDGTNSVSDAPAVIDNPSENTNQINKDGGTPIIPDGLKKFIDTGEATQEQPSKANISSPETLASQEHSTATTGQATEQQQTEDEIKQLLAESNQRYQQLLEQMKQANRTLGDIATMLSNLSKRPY